MNTLTGPLFKILGTKGSLGKYEITDYVLETKKKWIFRGKNLDMGLDICAKIYKPTVPLKSFFGEVENLKELTHPNIEQIFDAGEQEGFKYLISRWEDMKSFRELIDIEKRFNFEEIKIISKSLLNGLIYANKKNCQHTDVKPENFGIRNNKELSLEERVWIGDFEPWYNGVWGPTQRDYKIRNHVSGTALAIEELMGEKLLEEVPSKFSRTLENAKEGKYNSPEEFRKSLNGNKIVIDRRNFLKGIGAATALGAAGYFGFNIIEYSGSIDKIINEISKTSSKNFGSISPLFEELANRITKKKILPLVSERMPGDKFPYAISSKGNEWGRETDGTFWSDGFWPGILWESYKSTKDKTFGKFGKAWAKKINFSPRDDFTINPIRFYYSHALGYCLFKDEELLEKPIKAVNLIAERFNSNGNYFQFFGDVADSETQESQIDSMSLIPFLEWGYRKNTRGELKKMVLEHSLLTSKINLNDDGSTIQIMKFNPKTLKRFGGIKSGGYSQESCVSRGQARAINGFNYAYKLTNDERILGFSEKCANYFIENLPEDLVPFYDFKDPNGGIPKDSSAAAIASSALLDLFNLTSNGKYKEFSNKILKSLAVNYLEPGENYPGLLKHACANKNKGLNVDSSLIYGDYFFLEALNKVKGQV